MRGAEESISVGQTVNVDIAAGWHVQLAGTRPVDRVGLGKVKCAMKLAVGVAAIDHVKAFRRSMIALPRLRPHRIPA